MFSPKNECLAVQLGVKRAQKTHFGLKKTHSIFYFQKHDEKSQDCLIQTTCHESTFSADKPSRESPGWAKGYWKSLAGGQSLKFLTINFP